jgi:hypothetical protein|tara:strand:- start:975 stop:1460 length:486 start_codon:yes stop_codon:yes gene_type:complete
MHIKNEYDYMFESPQRKEIFNAIKYTFFQDVGMNVPVFGVPDNLKEYHTSKKDIIAGVQILPESHFRLRAEDIYKSDHRINTPRIAPRTPRSARGGNKTPQKTHTPKKMQRSESSNKSLFSGTTAASTQLSNFKPMGFLSPRAEKSSGFKLLAPKGLLTPL